MDKTYNHKTTETPIYKMWEDGGYFTAQKPDKKTLPPDKQPYCIMLPLPNANDPMHMGHALFTIEDILIRYHRMKGCPTLWLPGGDHAGIETQFVFEKKLAKDDKSRFDFDRETLYKMISEFVDQNRNINKNQMKQLGFSLDWTRYHFSLEPEIIAIVMDTFRKLNTDGLVYRDEKLVNFCTKCGTAFSDLEINHEEKKDQLYYLDYKTLTIATARPETIFADVAIAVNPKDKRYKKLIGNKAVVPIINKEIPVIADDAVEMDFGTGALKVTPGHDQTDFEIGSRNKLPKISVIDRGGRLTNVPDQFMGMRVKPGRIAVIDELKSLNKMVKTEELNHAISVCYRCKTVIEPILMPQWFVKTKPLAKPAIEAVKKGTTKIFPLKRFEKMYFDWLENILDWNISRQVVWGPKIPAWYCLDCNSSIRITFIDSKNNQTSGTYQELTKLYSYDEIIRGLQSLTAPVEAEYLLEDKPCLKCKGKHIIQETDTFDTWFLSGQWPFSTLVSASKLVVGNKKSKLIDDDPDSDFNYFYPTSVLDTLWDILFFWVARMMMLGIYRTGKVPFEVIHIHSRVVDKFGQKMSKSKGNVINPIEMVDKYGADALRFALVFGSAPGSDISISDDKVRGMRNFTNKLWNIVRLYLMSIESSEVKPDEIPLYSPGLHKSLMSGDKKIISELNMLTSGVTRDLEHYRFSDSAQRIYDFTWHTLADVYLEKNKDRFQNGDKHLFTVMNHVISNILKLLHPFMPFITEDLYQKLPSWNKIPLIVSSWPK